MESSGMNPVFQDVEFAELVVSEIKSTEVSSPASVKDEKAIAVHQSSSRESSTSTSVVSHADNPEPSNANAIEQVTVTDSGSTALGNCKKIENGNDGKPLVIKISTRGNLQNSSTRITPAENGVDHLPQDSLYSKAQCRQPETAVLISSSSPADINKTDIMVSSQSKTVTPLQMLPNTNPVDNNGANISDSHVAGPVKTNAKTSSSCDAALVVVDDESDAEVTVLDTDSSQKQKYRQQQLVYDSSEEVISSDSEADSSTSEDESDSSSVESVSSSSEEEEEKERNEEKVGSNAKNELVTTKETSQKIKKKNGPKGPKRGNELTWEDLPKIEDLQISVPEEEAESIGVVTSIVDRLVVVHSHPNLRAIDLGSILFLKQGSEALGEIHDVMGCVARPYYVVRFNSRLHITERGIAVGQEVFSAPRTNHCTFVDVEALTSKPGSDASWEHDMEPPPSLVEYSDDEEEQRIRRAKKNRNRNEESFVIRPEQQQQQKRPRNENYFARSNGASNGSPPVRFSGQRGRGGGQAHHTAFSARNHYSNEGFRCSNSNQTANSHQSFNNPSFGSNFCPQPVRQGQFGPTYLTGPPPSTTLPSFAAPPPFARVPFAAPPPFVPPPSTPPPRSLLLPPPPPPPSPIFTGPPPSLNFTTPSQSGLPWAASSNSQYNTSMPPPPHRQPGPPGESEFPAAFSMSTPPPSSQYFDSHQRFGQPPPPSVVQGTSGGPSWDGGTNLTLAAPRQPVVGSGSSASQFNNPWAMPPPTAQSNTAVSSSVSSQFVPQFHSIPYSALNPSQPPTRPQ